MEEAVPEKILDVSDVRKSLQRFMWIDYVVFLWMLTICGIIGVYFGFIKKQKSSQDYLMGGRNMSVFPVTLSLIASFISGITLLGTPTETYLYGTQYMFIAGGSTLMVLIMSTCYLPVFHQLKLTSAYEYLEMRFDRRVRMLGSLLFSISQLLWLPIVIYVPALAFNQVTGVNIHIITPLVCIVCIFYTCVGGLKAVVWTDVVQTFVMFGAMILVFVKATVDTGGFGVVWSRNWKSGRIELPTFDIDPTTRHTVWNLVIGGAAHWLVSNAVGQSMLQRYLSLPDLLTAQKAVWGFLLGVLTLIGTCGFGGLVVFAKYHACDPLDSQLARAKDQLVPLLVMDVLGELPGLPGLFVAGVFSAALSSLSTGLNSMSAVVLEDFWKPYCRPLSPFQTQILMKSVVVLFGLSCVGMVAPFGDLCYYFTALVFVVERLGTVLQLSMSLSAVTNGPQLALFTMGIFFPWISGTAALAGGLTGMASVWWVVGGAQAAQATGHLKYPEKPRSTANCTYTYTLNTTDVILDNEDTVLAIFRISYLWYTLLGCTVSIFVALLVSAFMPNDNKKRPQNPKFFAPVLRPYLATRIRGRYKVKPSQVIELENIQNIM